MITQLAKVRNLATQNPKAIGILVEFLGIITEIIKLLNLKEMKKYFKPFMILYFALALLITGYFLINPSRVNVYEKLTWQKAFGDKPKLLSSTLDYKSFKYSLLGFSVGALVIYAIWTIKKEN